MEWAVLNGERKATGEAHKSVLLSVVVTVLMEQFWIPQSQKRHKMFRVARKERQNGGW